MQGSAPERPRHDTSVTMRMPQQIKELIESAASAVSKSFSAFMVESGRERALDVLLDQSVFNLTTSEAEAFAKVLDSPPPAPATLRLLMRGKSPWEA
jgi:uncharacterized protein (DUF1778 family)